MRIDQVARRQLGAAARTGRELLENETERAVDAALAGSLPEAVARSLARNHVVERVASEFARAVREEHDGRMEGFVEEVSRDAAVDSLVEALADQIVKSPAFKKTLSDVLASPEVRHGLVRQTTGFGAAAAAAARTATGRWDDDLERRVHRLVGGKRSLESTGFGGLATRGLALLADLVLAQAAFLAVTGSIALVGSLAGFHPGTETGIAAGLGWLVAVTAYFTWFWSTVGQTPAMRAMRLRVVTRDGGRVSPLRALVRFAGLLLAIAPAFVGFVPVIIDGRRRALQDFLAGTAVVREPEPVGARAAGGDLPEPDELDHGRDESTRIGQAGAAPPEQHRLSEQ